MALLATNLHSGHIATVGLAAAAGLAEASAFRRNVNNDEDQLADEYGVDSEALAACIQENIGGNSGIPASGGPAAKPAAGGAGGALPPAGGAGGASPPAGGAGGAKPPAGGAGGAEPPAGGAGGAEPPAGGLSAGRRRNDNADVSTKCIESITGIEINNDFANLADFGFDDQGGFDFENFDFDKAPEKVNGQYPLSGKTIKGIDGLDSEDFDFNNLDTYPDSFKVTEIELDFKNVPALLGVLKELAEEFAQFEPSKELFDSFDDNDKKKITANLKKTLDMSDVSDKLRDFLTTATKQEVTPEALTGTYGVSEDDAKAITGKYTTIVENIGKINFFKGMPAEEIAKTVSEKLSEAGQKALVEGSGLESLTTFCKLTNKAGFDTLGLKKLLVSSNSTASDDRRRADNNEETKKYGKKQVTNQGKLAKTQTDEGKRTEKKKEEAKEKKSKTNSATTIAISTVTIAASAFLGLF